MTAAHNAMHRKWFAAGLAGSVVLMGSAGPQQSFAQTLTDYDTNDNDLIEVMTLEQLNAIRYDLDGDGAPSNMSAYAVAFPTPATPMGCPTTCTGYELMADLDFDTSGDGAITADDNPLSWGGGSGWQPIGTSATSFTAEFHGNGNTISHLFISSTGTDNVGLFGSVGTGAVIRSVGLVEVNVTGNNNVGGLVGASIGTINAGYATGEVRGDSIIGALVGENVGTIHASYATGRAGGNSEVGGLVGRNFSGFIRASYATGEVSGTSNVGGLVGREAGLITASYATGEVSGTSNVGGLVGAETGFSSINISYFDTDTSGLMGSRGRTTAVLRSPTDYTGIYADWNVDLNDADADDNVTTGVDDPWDFGTNEQYPVLQVDFNGDGRKSWQEFGPQQSRPGVLVLPVELSLTEGMTGSYTVVLLSTPTASVTVTPVLNNAAAVAVSVSDELIFMPGNWDTEQTVTVSAEEDDNAVGERVSLMHTVVNTGNYASVTASNVTVNVTDNDSPVSVSTGTLSLMEGTTGSYTVVLLTTPTVAVMVTPVSSSTETVSVVSGELTFMRSNWNTAQTVTVRAEDDDDADNERASLTHTVDSDDPNYNTQLIAPVVRVNVTDDDGIRVRVRVFLEGPLR